MKSRKSATDADRALCPPAVSIRLSCRIVDVAASMRTHNIAGPLNLDTVERWLDGSESMPQWLAELLADKTARAAAQYARKEFERVEAEHAELLRFERVYQQLESGKRRFGHADMDIVEDVAFRASKELARGATADDLSPVEIGALRVFGVNPEEHWTWDLHAGECNGSGDSCIEGAANRAAERFELREIRRRAHREFVSVAKELIRTRAVSVGDVVQIGHGHRVGTVVAILRSRVRVRFIGYRADGYLPIEKPIYPQNLTVVSASGLQLSVGEHVRFVDRGGHIRNGAVVEVDGPLFRADYLLVSGASRCGWFDTLCLAPEHP